MSWTPGEVRPRRVLLVSTSVGAGHNQAAAAIQAALHRRCADVETEFIDVLEHVPWWFRAYYGGGYAALVTKLQWIYGLGYRITNRPRSPRRTLAERRRLFVERLVTRRFRRHMLDRRPVLVVATHYLAMPLIGRLIGAGTAGLRMMAVITDNDAHRFWYAENVERYFVPHERLVERMLGWGVGRERITVSGIPVHPKWVGPLGREAILTRWRLPAEVPIVLLSGGAFFTVGPVERIARGILERTAAHVVVLAGANKKLLDRLSRRPEVPERLTPVPFTDRANELAEVASLMVTKAGGVTTAECIARGLPMVLTRPVPGQEAANAELFAAEGAAVIAPSAETIVGHVGRLLDDGEALEAAAAAARGLYRPAAETIVSAIRQALAARRPRPHQRERPQWQGR